MKRVLVLLLALTLLCGSVLAEELPLDEELALDISDTENEILEEIEEEEDPIDLSDVTVPSEEEETPSTEDSDEDITEEEPETVESHEEITKEQPETVDSDEALQLPEKVYYEDASFASSSTAQRSDFLGKWVMTIITYGRELIPAEQLDAHVSIEIYNDGSAYIISNGKGTWLTWYFLDGFAIMEYPYIGDRFVLGCMDGTALVWLQDSEPVKKSL